MAFVFIVDQERRPLAPVHPGYARWLLSHGKEAVLYRAPFTLKNHRKVATVRKTPEDREGPLMCVIVSLQIDLDAPAPLSQLESETLGSRKSRYESRTEATLFSRTKSSKPTAPAVEATSAIRRRTQR